jgi:hypothetical protein
LIDVDLLPNEVLNGNPVGNLPHTERGERGRRESGKLRRP